MGWMVILTIPVPSGKSTEPAETIVKSVPSTAGLAMPSVLTSKLTVTAGLPGTAATITGISRAFSFSITEAEEDVKATNVLDLSNIMGSFLQEVKMTAIMTMYNSLYVFFMVVRY
jgi:hypothetical protein